MGSFVQEWRINIYRGALIVSTPGTNRVKTNIWYIRFWQNVRRGLFISCFSWAWLLVDLFVDMLIGVYIYIKSHVEIILQNFQLLNKNNPYYRAFTQLLRSCKGTITFMKQYKTRKPNQNLAYIIFLQSKSQRHIGLLHFISTPPPYRGIPNFSNPSLEFPGYLLHDTL
jgi:hypothetical protein